MEIRPQAPYTISFFITDHTDTNTYYCRAVVYDTTTGELLETHNLSATSGNSRLFNKRAQAPGDPSGQGRKITIVATAYSDAGYTIKSPLYQEQAENYVVIKAPISGGGFGTQVDYRTIREIVQEEISKIPAPEKIEIPEFPIIPEQKEPDLTGIISAINSSKNDIEKKIELIKISSVINAIDSLKNNIDSIEIPEHDMSSVLNAIKELEIKGDNELEVSKEDMKKLIDESTNKLETSLPEIIKDIFFYRAMAEQENITKTADRLAKKPTAKEIPEDIKKIIGL